MITQEILSTSTSNEFPIRLENEARCNHNVTILDSKFGDYNRILITLNRMLCMHLFHISWTIFILLLC